MGVKGIKIRLLNTDLIRRFGKCDIEVDPQLARTYVDKKFAKYYGESNLSPNKNIISNFSFIDFIRRQTIFPNTIIHYIEC